MSTDGDINLVWGGDKRRFRLAIENLLALQEKRNSGPLEIATRLRLGSWKLEDITDTIRIGLIGAGVDWKTAEKLVADHIKPGQISYHAMTAFAILMAALQGAPEDETDKKKDEPAGTATEHRIDSPPAPSTEAAQS